MKRAVALFWLIIATGVCVPAIVAIATDTAKGDDLPSAAARWFEHLFEPGYNEFLLTLIGAAPFLVLAVFSLFHATSGKRVAGVAGALMAAAAVTIWGEIAIRTSRSSTAAIGFLFLPFEAAMVMPAGYLVGRLVAKIRPLNR
jgi:hypothetical protein